MQYIALIYSNEAEDNAMSPADREKLFAGYWAFTKAVKDAGVHVAGDALQPVATATTVSVRNGETITTDGPFAETKEQLGGYYLLECKNLDEAIEWAAKIPTAKTGRIEVRPIVVFDNMP
jgi:hypothetical protein